MKTTKKLMTLLLALMLPVTAFALPLTDYINYEFEVDGIYYIIKNDAAWVTFPCYECEDGMPISDYQGDVIIPTTVTYQDKTYPVSAIDNYAFNYSQGLNSITIPETITIIGNDAFYNCKGLARVNITDIEAWCNIDMQFNPLVYAHHLYLNDTEVTDLTIPEGITAIGNYAFQGCTGLTSVTIPNTVTIIGNFAFDGCTGIKSVNIPNSVTEIGDLAFENCSGLTDISISDSVTKIGPAAFEGCTGLTSLYIGKSVMIIHDFAFRYCSGLTTVKIPDSVAYLGMYAFEYCTGLKTVSIGKSVRTIDSGAFKGCSGLKSIKIPDSVTEMGGGVFRDCTSLRCVTLGKSVGRINVNSFQNDSAIEAVTCKAMTPPWWYFTDMFSPYVYNHAPLYVPKGSEQAYKTSEWGRFSTIIGVDWEQGMGADVVIDGIYYVLNEENATATVTNYSNGPSQTAGTEYSGDIVIPETIITESGKTYTVTAVGDYAFIECTLLSSITMPSSLTEIGRRAFMGCVELESAELPNSLTTIGERAFEGCTNLMTFDFPSSLKSIGESAFSRTGWYDLQPEGLVYAGTVAYHYKGTIPEDTHLLIQEGTTSIADAAFYADEKYYLEIDNYEGLLSVDIPNSVKYIGNFAFIDDCINLQHVSIGSGVEDMGNCAFAWIPNLTDVTISEGVKLIGKQMFSGCPNLKRIIIPNSVEVIKYRAFAAEEDEEFGYIEEPACISLTDVTIGSGVKTIEAFAFSGCTALTRVTCLATTPPVMADDNCFDDECYKNATLIIPLEAVDVYSSAPIWEKFTNIQPLSSENIPGDVNGDGLTNITDLNTVIDVVIMGGNAGHTRMPKEDMNGDGMVNISDVNAIIYIILNN